jgi:ABC-type multidrug transport system permease subunit
MLGLLEGNKFSVEEKIKAKYERKKQIKIAKDNAITDYKKAVLENKKRLIPQLESIKELKRKMKEPAIRRRISNVLIFLAVIMTMISTLTTIAGGYNNYSTLLTIITFVSFVSLSQLTILIISCLKPYLAIKATKYINISLFVQMCLLMVSISYNFMFIHNSGNNLFISFLNLILCVLFDLIVLLMCEISFTIRLNLEFKTNENISIFSRILKIFSSLIDYKITSIENSIKSKMFSENENNINDLEVKKYLDYAKETLKENNQLPSYKEIGNKINISERKAKNIHSKLLEKGITKTENNKTFLLV